MYDSMKQVYQNSQVESRGGKKRHPIVNSVSPEDHVLYVWDTIVSPVSNLSSICLLTNGNGSSLAVDIV